MPTSGARSGTQPSRSDRGAGTGRIGPLTLRCGHHTHDDEPVVVYPSGRRLYRCPNGCGLQTARTR